MPSSVRIHRVARGGGAALIAEVDGRWLDLSAWLEESEPSLARECVPLLASGFCERATFESALARGRWTRVEAPAGVLAPVEREHVGKILALGKNFRAHAAEFGEEVPEEPLFFDKLPEAIADPGASVSPPSGYAARFDHEAELAVLIGRPGSAIDEARALEHVAGYTVANDLTLRTMQGDDRKKKFPWFRSKNFDGACPLGPCLVPRDWLDVSDLRVTARVRHRDGSIEPRQDASTRDLVVGVPRAIAWLSRHLTLRAGDLILMGTPAGVGPLVDGDVALCAVAGIGELATPVVRR
jgi:2-keto-4-pentenoate hydratase/2-oxohepta-3-ene-1,7-dioic acid hydratase in catechol pathway